MVPSLETISPILRVVLLFMVSFAVQKPFSLGSVCLYLFLFIFFTLGGGSKKILLQFMSNSVLPILSFKSLIISSLTNRFLIHFEFIFCVKC